MPAEANGTHDYRVLVLAPTRRDREVTRELLQRAKIFALCQGALSMAAELETAVGAILLTDAAFSDPHIDQLLGALSRQPPWSEVPIILLCRTGRPSRRRPGGRFPAQRYRFGTTHFIAYLVSSVQAALRARARQYQLRDQFQALRTPKPLSGTASCNFERRSIRSHSSRGWHIT